ncbi:MAG: PEP-CTERM sorting domain-containing protein [Armatimonadetes bacterium]|nr:PEP-CTERM sorting domain-containing protein [Armatimonadota bacterium]
MPSRIAFVVALLLACCVAAAPVSAGPVQTWFLNNYSTAPSSNGPGYGFTYESLVQSPGESDGYTYTDWWYDFYLENNSTDHWIVSWTFTPLWPGCPGVVMSDPGNDPCYGSWPLPPSQGPLLSQTSFREENFVHPVQFQQIMTTITWDDGHQEQVPVFMPLCVPEPGSLAALAIGVTGVGGAFLKRRRSR